MRLLRLVNSSKAELEAKFGRPTTAAITHLRVKGEHVPMRLDSSGGWESGRTIDTNNKASHSDSRGDLLSTPAKLKEQLESARRKRKKSEEQLELRAELDRQRKLYWDARVKTLRKQDGQYNAPKSI